MATTKKEVKPTPVKRVTKTEEKKNTEKNVSQTKKVETVTPNAKKKTTVKNEDAKAEVKTEAKKTTTSKTVKRVDTTKPIITSQAKTATAKTVYHVTKRDNDGREWKVFIQGSSKVIKLFDTQAEALEYATSLCKNKDDGSYVLLHGLNGKIRKY